MKRQVVWLPEALDLLKGFFAQDPVAVGEVYLAVGAALADDPPSGQVFPHGPNGGRLRVGRYRVTYLVDLESETVHVYHVGRVRSVPDQ